MAGSGFELPLFLGDLRKSSTVEAQALAVQTVLEAASSTWSALPGTRALQSHVLHELGSRAGGAIADLVGRKQQADKAGYARSLAQAIAA